MSEVARRNGASVPGSPVTEASLNANIQRWRRLEGEVEDRLWKLALVADSVVGLGDYGEQTVARFADAVGTSAKRIYQLCSVWRLRRRMFGADPVPNRADGQPLVVSHFTLALSEADPELVIDEAIALSLSTSDLYERAKERRRERGRKAIRETVGASDPPAHSVHIVRKSGKRDYPGHEDTCDVCGGFLMQTSRLGRVMDELGASLVSVSSESGVSEDLIERMLEGQWVNQQMGMRVAEAMQKRITERERRQ